MKEYFGTLPSGQEASLYTISCGQLSAVISDLGATLVRLFVPDRNGALADVVLGFDSPESYLTSDAYFGATVGRNANRVKNACFILGNRTYCLDRNDGPNNLHSGFSGYHTRLWTVKSHTQQAITLSLQSPHNDQGFPGNATIDVTYTLEPTGLRIAYDAISDRDTVFNLTNHSYFNLAGHDQPHKAMAQTLTMPARHFTLADAQSIPTGALPSVEDTPMDFRAPKVLGQDLESDFAPLQLQKGIDHNFEVFCNPAAILQDPESGRTMAVITDLPGIQVYSANYTNEIGKNSIAYPPRCGVALETQFYPDAVNNPQWKQPFVKAGESFHTETEYRFL